MNRKELAQELMRMANDLSASGSAKTASDMSAFKRVAARRMLFLAKRLQGFDTTKEFEESVKAVGALATQFKDVHANLIKEITELEKTLKEKQEILKAYYKDWATQSGYKALRTAVLQQAQQCMAIGDTLDNLADDLVIQRRESEQESYKEKYNVLVSTLNEAELKKYSRILNAFFNKQITELKTGLKILDDDLKQWHEEAQAIAEERGIKLPKASMKQANILEDVVDAIKSAIPKLVSIVKDFFSGLLDKITRNGRVLDAMDRELGTMVAKARSIL